MAEPLNQVTPLILTYNEEANIQRTLAGLQWAKCIFIVDSGSTDHTLEIIAKFSQAEVVQRPFDSFADQCNFGLSLIQTPWCLSLDSDHIVTPAFKDEMAALLEEAPAQLVAVKTPFQYLVHGRPVKSSLLPPRFNLLKPGHGFYVNDGHGHQFLPSGLTTSMRQPILHDDRKSLERWMASQSVYHRQEANKLFNANGANLGLADRIRKSTPLAPLLVIFICLIVKRGLFDGRAGIYYAFQRCFAEIQIWLMLMEMRYNKETHNG